MQKIWKENHIICIFLKLNGFQIYCYIRSDLLLELKGDTDNDLRWIAVCSCISATLSKSFISYFSWSLIFHWAHNISRRRVSYSFPFLNTYFPHCCSYYVCALKISRCICIYTQTQHNAIADTVQEKIHNFKKTISSLLLHIISSL